MIPKLIEYGKLLDQGKTPKGEDYVNKTSMESNDVFCLVFTLLSLCNSEFESCFTFLGSHNDCIVKFNENKFKELLNDFFFSIAYDKNLIFVIKKLLNIQKYDTGMK